MNKDEKFWQWVEGYVDTGKCTALTSHPLNRRYEVIDAMRAAWQAGYDAHVQEIKDFIAGKLQGEDEHGKSE